MVKIKAKVKVKVKVKEKEKLKPELKALGPSAHLYILSVCDGLHSVIFVVGVRYSSWTNGSVLPSQHDNLPVPFLFLFFFFT